MRFKIRWNRSGAARSNRIVNICTSDCECCLFVVESALPCATGTPCRYRRIETDGGRASNYLYRLLRIRMRIRVFFLSEIRICLCICTFYGINSWLQIIYLRNNLKLSR